MKKFLKVVGYILCVFLLCLYFSFLFILPHKIDLNVYKPQIQKLVKDNTNLTVDFDKVNVITSPFLEAGIKTKNIKVKLPDNSVLFSADSFKGKVFLPSLLWLTVRVSCAEVESPHLNVEIINSKKFKVAKVYEDLVNKHRQQRRLNPEKYAQKPEELPFDISSIKFNVPALKLNNYKAVIDDSAVHHKLTLKGDQLKLGYNNGKIAKLKTEAKFYSDKDKNITANLDIDTFLPKFGPFEQEDEDDEAIFELPFINPVQTYRDYNLKSNINSKLKIRKNKKDQKVRMNGFVDIEGTTVTMSGLQLPESYFRLKAKGTRSEIDTNLYVTDKEYLRLFGNVDYGKSPYVDLTLKSPKVHLDNILHIARAYLDTIHIKNDIDSMSASGYLLSNATLKTDFTEIHSAGKIIIRDGNILDRNIGLIFNNINANLLMDNDLLRVKDTHVLINNRPLKLEGKVDDESIANFEIDADKIPLPGLYKAFAPKDIKNKYYLTSGFITLNSKVTGEIKDIAGILKSDLSDIVLKDKNSNFILSNKLLHFGIANYSGVIRGKLTNRNFGLYFPKTGANIKDKLLVVNINNKRIFANKSSVNVNKKSSLKFSGNIEDYMFNPVVKFVANGKLSSSDIAVFCGSTLSPYLDVRGAIPMKATFNSEGKKASFVVQMLANSGNYITPVTIRDLLNKQTIIQLMAEKNRDTLKIYRTGIYARSLNAHFSDDLSSNLNGAKEVLSLRAMISNMGIDPFINIFKISVPKNLDASLYIFPKSKFVIGGQMFAFGNMASPRINGNISLRNISIPEILTTARQLDVDLGSRDINIFVKGIEADNSDFKLSVKSNWYSIAKVVLTDVKLSSKYVDVDSIVKVFDKLNKAIPSTNSTSKVTQQRNIPVTITQGSANLRKIKTGNIVANNSTGKISLYKNIFYIDNLKTHSMGGVLTGNVSDDLIRQEYKIKAKGKDFDMAKILLDVMNTKDTLSGKMNFVTDISLSGTTTDEQMKSLKGFADFEIKDGQLGPFGKFENFLMAENIRNNAFFSSTIGSVITNLVTFDTSRFNSLYGHLTFDKGIVDISPVKSQGNVMSMYILGKMSLLDNSADMKVRGKLASAFSDKLGPLANINPINLIKHTPGLNIVAVKTFALFCEEVSEAEMKAIPHLGKGKSDENATKFQIVLRGDTRKPLKMIKSFKWLALNSEIQSAKDFVDTIPTPVEGEEGLSVEELIKLRQQQAEAAAQGKTYNSEPQKKSIVDTIKGKFKK